MPDRPRARLTASIRGERRRVKLRLVWIRNGPAGPRYYWQDDQGDVVRGCEAQTIEYARELLADAYAAPVYGLRFGA
jgi:hypothetical protein